MAVDVLMPQMGESIAEGTVVRWIKKVGDKVERDEPLLEISTDKVDAEIPSPASGTLTEVLAQEGQTVAVNSVVARLATEGEAAAPKETKPEPAAGAQKSKQKAEDKPAAAGKQKQPADTPAAAAPETSARPEERVAPPAPAAATEEQSSDSDSSIASLEDRRRTRSSPVVRKIAKEKQVDISEVKGTGVSGRVTKSDILQYLESPGAAAAPAAAETQRKSATPAGEGIRIEPMSVMRRRIAEHMVLSKKTSAHVSTVFEMDFTEVDKLRRKHKAGYAERGANLTFLPFIVQAVIAGLREFPVLNASIDGDNVVYKQELNIGIAVALDWGLIVPVLKRADEKNVLGLAREINDLGERARMKKLNPDEVQGGTFTITNPGIYGGLFGLPIINQPQVAILGVGGVKKRPVVIETPHGDSIAIRSMTYVSLTFDHRLIDGAVADQFMAKVRSVIEAGQYMM